MAIADQLSEILQIKEQIRSAINAKGVALPPEAPFSKYSDAIGKIQDGQNGTVDLRDKFILAAGENHPVGDIGGEEEHTLTIYAC